MSASLLEWFRRLGQISGDSRQELIHAAQRHGWDEQSFALFVQGDVHSCRQLREQLSPKEVAAVIRAWRQDYPEVRSSPLHSGVPYTCPGRSVPPVALAAASADFQDGLRPGSSQRSSGYVETPPVEYDDVGKASRVPKGRRHYGQNELQGPSQPRGDFPEIGIINQRRHYGGAETAESNAHLREVGRYAERRHFGDDLDLNIGVEASESIDAIPNSDRRRFHQLDWRDGGGALSQPREHRADVNVKREDVGDGCFESSLDESLVFSGAFAIAVSDDGKSVYVAGASGLARFDTTSMQLQAHTACAGGRQALAGHPYGYADVVAGASTVICADLDGTLFIHHPVTCELLAEKVYEPSIYETKQRLIAGRLQRISSGITGLEGGYGVAPRITVSDSAIFIGGKDGVVTALAPQTLTVLARTQLCEGPQAVGVRMVYLAQSQQRLYASVLSVLHVLTPSFQSIAKLRGGPHIPIFGNICCAVESPDGQLAFAGDTGGPSIHVWDTATWKWLARVELVAGGGPARYLAVSSDNRLLYASTEFGRFLAFDISRMPPRCVEEGGGGGALAISKVCPEQVLVLTPEGLLLRGAEQQFPRLR
mmetsp:Transcript_107197/g.167426  ORF Transcript_107197/g.167426 Transcript_107197/m.167426 type:complete len:595 (-) Transcript_107197:57-1841(-)